MNLALPELHESLQAEAIRFAQQTLLPQAEALDGGADPAPLLAQAAELGFFGLMAPESEGGAELDALAFALVVAALAEGSPSIARVVANHTGPATQALVDCGLLSEAHVEGERVAFVREGHAPKPVKLLATADGVFERWTASEVDTLGHRAAHLCRFETEGPPVASLSEPARVFALRDLGLAAVALGSGRAALSVAKAYAKERTQFSRPIARFQAIQWKIADSETALAAAEACLMHAALHVEVPATSAARVMCARAAVGASDHAIQIHGGYGYTREYPVERYYRSARMCASETDRARTDVAASLLS